MAPTTSGTRRAASLSALALVVWGAAACTYYAEPTAAPSTSSPMSPTSSPTVPTPAPTTAPTPTTAGGSGRSRHETIRAVVEDAGGVQLCFRTSASLPPTCESGVALGGWSWDDVDVERVDGATTWVDQIYVRGEYDATTRTLSVDEARPPSDDDRERILSSTPLPDHSLPCEAPTEGWPERTDPFPQDAVAALDGYAGSWSDPSGQVMVVAVTGDLASAERSIRTRYDQGLCVVAAPRSAADLAAVEEALRAVDGVDVVSTSPWVDASGAWVRADVPTLDLELQAALDQIFGERVVRLQPLLLTVAP